MFKKNYGNSKGFKKNEGKGGTRSRGFYDGMTGTKTFGGEGVKEKKPYATEATKDLKKPFNKKPMKKFAPKFDYKKAIEVLGKDIVMGIKITNPKLLNGHIIELNDYVNAKTNNYLKDGDKLLRCKWQLKRIAVRTENGVQTFDLKGNNDTFKIDNRMYLVQMLFEENVVGKQGMKLCVNGFEVYALLRDFDYIELAPVPSKDFEYKYITIRGERKAEDKSLNTRRLELKITDSQMDKLEYLRQLKGKDCIADVVRKLIADA